MKIIKLFINKTLAVEGRTTDEKELFPALKMVLKAVNGVPGAQGQLLGNKLPSLV